MLHNATQCFIHVLLHDRLHVRIQNRIRNKILFYYNFNFNFKKQQFNEIKINSIISYQDLFTPLVGKSKTHIVTILGLIGTYWEGESRLIQTATISGLIGTYWGGGEDLFK